MVLLGYFVGEAIPNLDAFFFGLLAVVIGISLAPRRAPVARACREPPRDSSAND